MRAMVLEFEQDRMCQYLDKQYMLGDSLLVAPIFNEEGTGEYYLPQVSEDNVWTDFFTGQQKKGGNWYREHYDYCAIPLYVRPNTILPIGAVEDTPEYDYAKDVTLRIYDLTDEAAVVIYDMEGNISLNAMAKREGNTILLTVDTESEYRVELVNLQVQAVEGAEIVAQNQNTVLSHCVQKGCICITL